MVAHTFSPNTPEADTREIWVSARPVALHSKFYTSHGNIVRYYFKTGSKKLDIK